MRLLEMWSTCRSLPVFALAGSPAHRSCGPAPALRCLRGTVTALVEVLLSQGSSRSNLGKFAEFAVPRRSQAVSGRVSSPELL